MASLLGKVITVTGAASGMGRATASILRSRGASLALADVQSKEPKQFATSLRNSKDQNVTYATVDVSRSDQVNDWTKGVVRDFGRLDGSANIAGVLGNPGPIQHMSDRDYEQVMNVNAGGIFKCLRAQLAVLSPGGSIVNVACIAGLIGVPDIAAYVASKHAVIGFTKTAAKEVGHRGIRVNAVAPGSINTNMMKVHMDREQNQSKLQLLRDATPLSRIGEPEEGGKLIAWLLSDDASYVTATVVKVDGGMTG